MSETQRIFKQEDSVSESEHEKIRVGKGGLIEGVERGLRVDMFDHDDEDEDIPCICDLPEHAQDIIMQEFTSEDDA